MMKNFTRTSNVSPFAMVRLFLLIGLLTYAANAWATIRYVKETQTGTGDGSNWDNASSNLQVMINASAIGDEVWVAIGNYKRANSGESFSMAYGVKIFGGFVGDNETSIDERDLTNTANASILKGHGTSVVSVSSPITNTTVIDGFTITEGTMSGIYNIGASPTIKNCTIKNNTTTGNGGGIYNSGGAYPVLINCSFSNNKASYGGGLSYSSGATITNCSFTENEATYGGGIYNPGGSIVLTNCSFTKNTAYNGGGMYNDVGIPVLTNCLFANNTATYGGAMYNYYSFPKLRNCIIYGNNTGIANYNISNPTIQYSLVQGLTDTNNGNISGNTDPLFVDPENGNYRLQPCSPVINQGYNSYYSTGQTPLLTAITTDMDGQARFYGTVDMGAYEYQGDPVPFTGIFYVKANGKGTGTSWDCATGDLQAAIDASQSGDEVWVAGGTYQNKNAPYWFSMKEGVKIYGGFKGDETTLSQRDLTNTANTSALLALTSSVVKNLGDRLLTPAAVLDGFSISGGVQSGIVNSGTSPTFRNCIITGNSSFYSALGGGMYNEGSSPVLINCVISNNYATAFGGGICNFNSSSPVLINCTISGNKADLSGGGIYNESSTPILRNTIIYGNSSGIGGSDSDIKYSLVQGIANTNNGNISGDTDPLFVDAANSNYRLQLCSPVINKGSNTIYESGQDPDLTGITIDLDGKDRFYGSGTVDMGAYEFHQFTAEPVPGVTYVMADSTGTGTSWDCPTGDLQAAINAASSGEEVWVAGGTYTRLPYGPFIMKEGVKIYGGFKGDETNLAQRDWTIINNASILRRNDGNEIIHNINNGLTPAAVLDGFTITGAHQKGGISNGSVSPTFRNCIITGNSSQLGLGGGMYNESSSPVLINCLISNNSTYTYGGGMFNYNESSPVLINCIISGNTTDVSGGAIYNTGESTPILRNTIIYGNSSGIGGSESDIKYSLIQGLTNTDNGNISGDTDPLFVDRANSDYRLQPCSPVMNNGSNAFYNSAEFPYLANVTTDLLGEPRFYANSIVDMGAYEYSGDASVPTLAGNNDEFSQTISGNTIIGVGGSACTIIARLSPNGVEPLAGDVTAKVWVESTQPVQFVKRHYQLTPTTKPNIATAKVTLYFTQQEFDDFNAVNFTKLPLNPTDTENYKANLRIEKRAGSSNDGSGLPGSYDGAVVTINPLDPSVNGSITWNEHGSRWEVSFDVTGFSGFFAKTMEAALPLNLISFTGTKENGVNVLNWKTTSEINTLNFEVQSSSDAKTFTKLATVTAKGSGDHQYSYQDGKLYSGNVYYRLKMNDRDGSFAYSKIISVMNDAVSKATVHPNPAVETIILTISPTLLQSTATLYDVTGRPLQTITLTTNKQQVNVKSLSSGMYLLKFADGTTERFVKE